MYRRIPHFRVSRIFVHRRNNGSRVLLFWLWRHLFKHRHLWRRRYRLRSKDTGINTEAFPVLSGTYINVPGTISTVCAENKIVLEVFGLCDHLRILKMTWRDTVFHKNEINVIVKHRSAKSERSWQNIHATGLLHFAGYPAAYGWPSYSQLIIFTSSKNIFTSSKNIFTGSRNKTLAKATHN